MPHPVTMESRPPPLPSATLKRVLAVAKLDGITVVSLAGLGMLVSVISGDTSGVVVAGLIVMAGAVELTGVRQLRRRRPTGLRLLVASQLMLLLCIWGYVALRLWAGADEMVDMALTPDRLNLLRQAGVDISLLKEMIHRMLPMAYGIIALATLGYQGGMAWYYQRQTNAIATAIR